MSIAGTIMGKATGLVSTKVFAGFVAGAIAILSIMLWLTSNRLDNANGVIHDITEAVASVAGKDKLQTKEVIPTILEVGARRDVYKRERDGLTISLAAQSAKVNDMARQTREAKARANAAVSKVQTIIRERNAWIDEARSRSTRTETAALEEEARQMEEALDALYTAGF